MKLNRNDRGDILFIIVLTAIMALIVWNTHGFLR